MDLTQYLQSAEFPMFRPSKSGSGGVEKYSPSYIHLTTTSETLVKWAFDIVR